MSSSAIVDTILEILEEDKTKAWSQEMLAQAVLNTGKSGVSAPHQIVIAIRTLVASGRLSGNIRSAMASAIKWKPSQDEAAITALKATSKTIESLKAELETLRQTKPEDLQKLNAQVQDLLGKIQTSEQHKRDLEQKLDDVEQKLEKAKDSVLAVQVTKVNGETKMTKGHFNKVFKKIFKLAAAREEIFIYGPTGCGKTHICAQVADALDLKFGFISCTSGMSEGALQGRLLPVGEDGKFAYVPAEFVERFENGGLFLFDEFDAADANVVLVVNAALSNGYMAIGNRPSNPIAHRHPDFVCIVACNTVGTGASRTYSGRNKLDMATLDRFGIGKVFMDYDEVVEAQLCPDDALRARLLGYRLAINEHGLERAMSTRFLIKAYKMKHWSDNKDLCMTDEEIDEAYFQGWREDEMNKVKSYRPPVQKKLNPQAVKVK